MREIESCILSLKSYIGLQYSDNTSDFGSEIPGLNPGSPTMGRYIRAKKDPIWIGDGLLAQIAKKPKVAKVLTKKDLIEHIRRVLT